MDEEIKNRIADIHPINEYKQIFTGNKHIGAIQLFMDNKKVAHALLDQSGAFILIAFTPAQTDDDGDGKVDVSVRVAAEINAPNRRLICDIAHYVINNIDKNDEKE